ncbi:DUF2087 domain-containing protein [Luteimicrobium subarcticum]|uniref:DUF2087 domain-containing protein n=1 Tax=Luteimicrobium subarcticum TaxID=620910 RepID=A0A2M8WSV7_9MICO|nr:DUF2087 domain-containing protein [Luteimicrobium subarcticum]PJI94000.1 hypothetical protein CLV34_1483 [Luteimicrobium subarcticum]
MSTAPAPRGPERFLRDGRLEQMPRRWDDKRAVVLLLASRVLVLDEPTSERVLTERLAAVTDDPVGLRRAMVDMGYVSRTRDGSEYWRTVVVEP